MNNETIKPQVDIDEILNRQSLALVDIERLHQALDTVVRLNWTYPDKVEGLSLYVGHCGLECDR